MELLSFFTKRCRMHFIRRVSCSLFSIKKGNCSHISCYGEVPSIIVLAPISPPAQLVKTLFFNQFLPFFFLPLQVDSFPSELYSTDISNGPHLENNFRPVQKTGDRKVEESASLMSNAPIISTGLRPLAILFLLFVSRLTFLVPA